MDPVGVLQQDAIETALISLLSMQVDNPDDDAIGFRDNAGPRGDPGRWRGLIERPRWEGLRVRIPHVEPWFCGWNPLESGREYLALHPSVVPRPLVEAIGGGIAAAFPNVGQEFDPDLGRMFVVYALHPLRRLPKGYHGLAKGAQYYVGLHHGIADSGQEVYTQSLHGWHPSRNHYVPVLARTRDGILKDVTIRNDERGYWEDSREVMSMLASVALDAADRWQVRVEDSAAVWLASDAEGIHHLADLRDDPRSATGRRRPLLHWVQEHLRRQPGGNDLVSVRQHLRGITSFHLGSLQIRIHEPQKQDA